MYRLFEDIKRWTEQNGENLFAGTEQIQAYHTFLSLGFPNAKHEQWKNFPLDAVLDKDYQIALREEHKKLNPAEFFSCKVHHFETFLFSTYNGEFAYEHQPLTVFKNGIIAGSLMEAYKRYPHLVKPYLFQIARNMHSPFVALNSAFFQSGFFLYVPMGVKITKPFQLVNIINSLNPEIYHLRNLIIIGKGAEIELLQCDDSVQDKNNLVNVVNEFFIDENASCKFIKLQNKDLETALITTSFIHQERNSYFHYDLVTFNAGIIRNEMIVDLNANNAKAELNGLYLLDKKQILDTHLYVNHNAAGCYSRQNFKGILDEEARAIFRGHIKVASEAQQTNAYQNNKNILLTPTAQVFSEPFLEIYADDVKCSHGSSVGKLDEEAIYYLKQRGICERDARLILMYAFAHEIIENVEPEVLKTQLERMVDKRLRGELHPCSLCVLHCVEKSFEFRITL
ncbi:MAG: Fe-S cluster assembly protein SufD [Bacteroidales bacterium]|nr:Fe-S cluster assembly protein SufD [Bacteroidales bacterium]